MSNLKEICENFDATIAAVKNTYQTKIAELETEIEKLQLAATKPPVENTLHESTNPFEDKAKIEELEIVKTQLAALTNELATTKANLEATEAKRKSVWKKYDNLMAQVNIIRENHKQELEKAQGSVSESITAKDAEITTLKARVGELVDEVKKLNAVIAEHERNEVNQSAYIDKLTEEFDMKTVSVSVVQRRCEEAEAKAKQLESTNAAQNLEIKRLADLNKQLAANIEAYKIENERLARNNDQHVKNVGVYKANEQYLSEQITQLKAENTRLNEALKRHTNNNYGGLMSMLGKVGATSIGSPDKQNNVDYTVRFDNPQTNLRYMIDSVVINAIIQYFNANNKTLPRNVIITYSKTQTVTIIYNWATFTREGSGGGSVIGGRKEYALKAATDGNFRAFTTTDDGSKYTIDSNSPIAEAVLKGVDPQISNSIIIRVVY
ncbi:hypothetical protein E24_00361 [Faustovirus]|nr:hypothetical protein PRJ_Fausto_00339 [Faustovirus]AMN83277.1 hypothetical protein E24_00361 [Faustovirus]AMN84260.1 hypothetical protein D5a_00358 [Faustovirus]AMN85248.1 hypothetical protein E23_00361 [Faustovirus]QBR99246.1 hypothetical protein [Faustovirus mariensis]